jgi:hypothetical protein
LEAPHKHELMYRGVVRRGTQTDRGFWGETRMSSLTAWMINLTLSLCAIILAAGANSPVIHMAASGAVSLVVALMAVREHASLMAEGANKSKLGGSTARHIGLVWAWGGLGILVTYALILEERWPEWPQFFIGFIIAAAGCLIFAKMLDRDAETKTEDQGVMKLGRILVTVQLAGRLIALISLLVDQKFPPTIARPDWAASNIFFFGGLAIAAISLNALLYSRR